MINQMIIYRLKISALQKKCTSIFPPTVVINIMLKFSFYWNFTVVK